MANTVSTILSDETLNRIIQIESAGKLQAKASTSSATGLGQFLNATWLDTLKKHRPDLFNGAPFNDELALRTDPKIAVEMLARFTEDNARALGVGWRDGDLYLAHFLGIGTAKKFLRADPGASAETLAGAAAVRANRSILSGKTAGQVRAWAQTSMEQRWDRAGRPDWVAQYYGGAKVAKAPAPLPVPTAAPTTKQDAKEVGWLSGAVAAVTGGMYALWGNWAFRVALFLLVAVALYWFVARPILRRLWALNAVEADLLTRLRLALKGVKTKLFSWLLGIAGVALTILGAAEGIDWSAFLPDIFGIPASIYQYAILGLIGWAVNTLRNATTTPVGQTDLALAPSVASPPIAPDIPVVKVDLTPQADMASQMVDVLKNARQARRPRAKVKRKKARA